MLSRVKDTVTKDDDRAQLGISRAREANNFTTHTVLLRRKCECGERGGTDVGISSKEKVEAAITDPKLDVTEAKGGGLAGGNRVFTRACIHPGEGDRRKRCCTCRQWQGYRA
jgi:hypothetical protein